jgi:hypothetical protein
MYGVYSGSYRIPLSDVTGTMLANGIPLSIRTAKTLSTFKKMNRGNAIKCGLTFRTEKGATCHAGLVCWQD